MHATPTAADVIPLRLLAERLHRLDLEAARLRGAAVRREVTRDVRREAGRRELLRAFEVARYATRG
jgi:hypothetical protein